MPRHSKNNTASAVFTKAEYGMLKDVWGSSSQRLGSESMRHFDQCSLCLATAQSPVACAAGHLFCRECILTSLLNQKRDIAQLKTSLDRLAAEHEQQRQRARKEAIDRVERDFERAQGASGRPSGSGNGHSDGIARPSSRRKSQSPDRERRDRSASPQRVLTLADLPSRITLQKERAIADAMRSLDKEQAMAKKDRIPAYWLPTLTPSADSDPADVARWTEEALATKGLETRCYVGDKHGHPTTIKSLVDVKFVTEQARASVNGENGTTAPQENGASATLRKICPGCRKAVGDVTHLYTLRRCGHVHCSKCTETLIKPMCKKSEEAAANADKDGASIERARCLECGTAVKTAAKDIIALQREGTGFASGGLSESAKKGIAFQG